MGLQHVILFTAVLLSIQTAYGQLPFICPAANGVFPNQFSTNCRYYWQCINGIPILSQCSSSQQFDDKRGHCRRSRHVSCNPLPNIVPPVLAPVVPPVVVAPIGK